MTKFTESKFTVGGSKEPGAQQRYEDSWERMFGKERPSEEKCNEPVRGFTDRCVLRKGHEGEHWCNDGMCP